MGLVRYGKHQAFICHRIDIQHIANDLREAGRPTSEAIRMAVGIVKKWAAGIPTGGMKSVHPDTQAAARKAVAEWEAAKATAHASHSHTADRSPTVDLAYGSTAELAGAFDAAKHPRAPKGAANGGQFGAARNADAAKAQQDPKAKASYQATLGQGDAAKKIAAMTDAELEALAKAAYSFKSNDPKVVALRILIANALAKRGLNVNDYGGLGPKSKPGAKAATPAKRPAAKAAPKKAATAKKGPAKAKKSPLYTGKAKLPMANDHAGIELTMPWASSQDGPKVTKNMANCPPSTATRRAMASKGTAMPDGSYPIADVAALRKAIQAFGRAKPADRAKVKAHIKKRARQLNVPNLIPADWRN